AGLRLSERRSAQRIGRLRRAAGDDGQAGARLGRERVAQHRRRLLRHHAGAPAVGHGSSEFHVMSTASFGECASFPPHSYGEVSASYADGGVMGGRTRRRLMTPPSRITAPPPHLNGEEKIR